MAKTLDNLVKLLLVATGMAATLTSCKPENKEPNFLQELDNTNPAAAEFVRAGKYESAIELVKVKNPEFVDDIIEYVIPLLVQKHPIQTSTYDMNEIETNRVTFENYQ